MNRNHRGVVRWKAATYTWVSEVLANPIYAGAYAYGRTKSITAVRDGEPHVRVTRVDRENWSVLLRDRHEAYITWEHYERIQQMTAKNAQSMWRTGAPKSGMALLAGLLRCRRCGQKLRVGYSGLDGRVHRYGCSLKMQSGAPLCMSFSGIDVDDEVARNVLTVVQPAGVEAALTAEKERGVVDEHVLETLRVELKAAVFAENIARRQYDAVDPANRLVADELERRWNAALERRSTMELRIKERQECTRAATIAPDRALFDGLAAALGALWRDPRADMRVKKRIVRTLIEEIIADVDVTGSEITLVIHWKGGIHTELSVRKRRRGENRVRTPPDVDEAIRVLALVIPDARIASSLNHAGVKTARGNPWTSALVTSFRSARAIPLYSVERKNEAGWLMLEEAAELVGVAALTLKRAVARGVVTGRQPLAGGPWLFRREELLDPAKRQRLKKRGPRERKAAPKQLVLGITRT